MSVRPRIYQAAVLLLAALFLGGCAPKVKYELRETAIGQMEAGDYAAAVQTFNEALENSDGFVGRFELDVLKYRAEAEYRSGDPAAAAETYHILWQVDEEKTEYLSRTCAMLVLSGQLDAALEAYARLYEAQPSGGDTMAVLLALGKALRGAGRDGEAAAILQQAVDDGAQNGELYDQLALCEMKVGEYDQALAFIEKGLAIGGTAREMLLFDQAAAREGKLDFAGALSALETYVREFGSTDAVAKEIAFLRTRVGQGP